ncbi:hypothetical protein FXB78_04845 [Aggregatibacter actinomycetemcomitans]|nr:hypothetical protein FXB78_04845 [Aggregatibacter actinomycetemcomitans]
MQLTFSLGKARQGKARQGKARQGKARQGKHIFYSYYWLSSTKCNLFYTISSVKKLKLRWSEASRNLLNDDSHQYNFSSFN